MCDALSCSPRHATCTEATGPDHRQCRPESRAPVQPVPRRDAHLVPLRDKVTLRAPITPLAPLRRAPAALCKGGRLHHRLPGRDQCWLKHCLDGGIEFRRGDLESLQWWPHPQRLVRPFRVVVGHPGSKACCSAACGGVLVVVFGEELRAYRLGPPLHLPCGGRRSGCGQQMPDPVLGADPVEQHLGRAARRAEPGNDWLS
jgi:hypothetical protein